MVVHQQLDQLNHLIADRIGMIGHGNNGSEALSRSTNGSSWNAAAGVLQGMSGGPLGTNLPFGNALLPWNQFPLGSLTNSQPNLQLLALHRINELSRYQANNTSNGLLMGLGLPGQNQPPTLLDYQHRQGPRSGTSMPNAPKNNVSPVPSVDSEDFIDDIFLKARVHKSQVYKPWLEKFRLLLRFRAKYGHCDVPLRTEFEGKKLGIWVNEQRRYKIGKKNRNTLAPERERLLNEIGFAWVGTQERSKKWLKNYEALRNFKQLYGHCLIPQVSNSIEKMPMNPLSIPTPPLTS